MAGQRTSRGPKAEKQTALRSTSEVLVAARLPVGLAQRLKGKLALEGLTYRGWLGGRVEEYLLPVGHPRENGGQFGEVGRVTSGNEFSEGPQPPTQLPSLSCQREDSNEQVGQHPTTCEGCKKSCDPGPHVYLVVRLWQNESPRLRWAVCRECWLERGMKGQGGYSMGEWYGDADTPLTTTQVPSYPDRESK